MFKIDIIAVGKNKDRWVDDAVDHFQLLLKKYCLLNLIYVPDIKKARSLSPALLKKAEAERIRKYLKTPLCFALADRGRSLDTPDFARWLQALMHHGGHSQFIIGGAFGLDEALMHECRETISLSPLTMSHQLVRPVLLEQLYRAFSILSGSGYHK